MMRGIGHHNFLCIKVFTFCNCFTDAVSVRCCTDMTKVSCINFHLQTWCSVFICQNLARGHRTPWTSSVTTIVKNSHLHPAQPCSKLGRDPSN